MVGSRATPGGSPFNTARALGRLGVPTAFVGHLSDDAYGRELLATLEADGVNVDLVSVGPEKTTLAVASMDSGGRARYEFVIEGTSAPQLTRPPALDANVRVICFGSLGLVLEPMASTLLELVERERGRRVIVLDPNIRAGLIADGEYRERLARAIYSSATVKASDADLAWMYPGLDAEQAADRLLHEGVRLAVVTLGAGGAFAAHGRGKRVFVPAPEVDVVDTIGAGDAFGAALLAWLHDHRALASDFAGNEELREALEFACRAAAITCSRAGADPPWRREMAPPG